MTPNTPLPEDPELFDGDDRITFDETVGKFTTTVDGFSKDFDPVLKSWSFREPTEEQELAWKASFGGTYPSDNGETAITKKRKVPAPEAKPKSDPTQPKTKAIYITGLPSDVTVDEIVATFKKVGMVDMNEDGELRVTIYTDSDGNAKGDALLVYMNEESVLSAIKWYDDYTFRPPAPGKIYVQAADPKYRKSKPDTVKDGGDAPQQKKRKMGNTNGFSLRDKALRQAENWHDDNYEYKVPVIPEHYVIIKNMFTLFKLEQNVADIIEIKNEVRKMAEKKFGKVTWAELYDLEQEGIVAVRLADAEQAKKFAAFLNGTTFDERRLTAFTQAPKPKFRKSDGKAKTKMFDKSSKELYSTEVDNAAEEATEEKVSPKETSSTSKETNKTAADTISDKTVPSREENGKEE